MGTVAAEPEDAPLGRLRKPRSLPREQAWAALKRFLRGCQHAMLYPEEHVEFGEALKRTFDGCRGLLAVLPTCTLHLEPQGLCLMGELYPPDTSVERFAAKLQERKIPAVTFVEGTTEQEVLEFIRLLKADPELIAAQDGAEAWLKRCGVQHIALLAPRLPSSAPLEWESFAATHDATDRMALQKLLALCPQTCWGALPEGDTKAGEAMLVWLAEALGAAAAALPQASPSRDTWLREAAHAVGELKPELRGRLFRVPVSPDLDVLDQIASLLPPQEAAEILGAYPNAVVGEPSEQLETVLRRLMPNPERARQVEPLAKAMLLARNMTEESYQSVVSLVLKKNPSPAAQLLDQETRAGEVRRVSFLADLLSSASAWEMRENRVDMLLELVASPGAWDGRQRLVQDLAGMIPASLAERDDEGAVELLRRVEETIALEALSPADKRLLRAHLTQACSPEFCRRIAHYILRQPSQDNLVILWLMGQAEGGLNALLQVAQGTSLPWLQGGAGAAIVHMGERSVEVCYQKLRRGAPAEAIALARALVLSGTREGLERALWAEEHPDPTVVAGLMEALAYSRDPTATRVLLDALRGRCLEVQCVAARSLGRHPSEETVAALGGLLAGPLGFRRIELVTSVLEALGQIGMPECVSVLHAVLRRKPVLFRGRAREVWARAAQALAAIPDPCAEQALAEEAGRNSPELSTLCADALAQRQSGLSVEVAGEAAG